MTDISKTAADKRADAPATKHDHVDATADDYCDAVGRNANTITFAGVAGSAV